MEDLSKDRFCLNTSEECMQDDIITVGLTNGVCGETT